MKTGGEWGVYGIWWGVGSLGRLVDGGEFRERSRLVESGVKGTGGVGRPIGSGGEWGVRSGAKMVGSGVKEE